MKELTSQQMIDAILRSLKESAKAFGASAGHDRAQATSGRERSASKPKQRDPHQARHGRSPPS